MGRLGDGKILLLRLLWSQFGPLDGLRRWPDNCLLNPDVLLNTNWSFPPGGKLGGSHRDTSVKIFSPLVPWFIQSWRIFHDWPVPDHVIQVCSSAEGRQSHPRCYRYLMSQYMCTICHFSHLSSRARQAATFWGKLQQKHLVQHAEVLCSCYWHWKVQCSWQKIVVQ